MDYHDHRNAAHEYGEHVAAAMLARHVLATWRDAGTAGFRHADMSHQEHAAIIGQAIVAAANLSGADHESHASHLRAQYRMVVAVCAGVVVPASAGASVPDRWAWLLGEVFASAVLDAGLPLYACERIDRGAVIGRLWEAATDADRDDDDAATNLAASLMHAERAAHRIAALVAAIY